MAEEPLKISELPEALDLAGVELVAVVQNGETRKALAQSFTFVTAIPVDVGSVSYDDSGGSVEITVTSVWGVDANGDPYYDDTGVTQGDEAALYWDPQAGNYVLYPYDFNSSGETSGVVL